MILLSICPVCGYSDLFEPPYSDNSGSCPSFEVCSCCGFEFGYDDHNKNYSFSEYRDNWITNGFPFYYQDDKPKDWNKQIMELQLRNVTKVFYVPRLPAP